MAPTDLRSKGVVCRRPRANQHEGANTLTTSTCLRIRASKVGKKIRIHSRGTYNFFFYFVMSIDESIVDIISDSYPVSRSELDDEGLGRSLI